MNYVEIAQQKVADDYPIIVYARPTLSMLPKGAIIGTWSISVPGKMRYILDKSLELATGVLPADVSRAWIRDTYLLPFKRREAQMTKPHVLPLHAVRGHYDECVYVDIRSAYLKILQLGYDVEYERGKYIAADPLPVPDEIAKNKFCYAIAVSMSSSKRSSITIKGDDTFFSHKPLNMFSNPCLYNLACDTLACIASEVLAVLREHCVYINTDGFIVESGYERFAIDIVRSWGFDAREKHRGQTDVFGVAAWRVGSEATKRYNPNALDFTSELPTRAERSWLKYRWSKWAKQLPSLIGG